MNNFFLSWSAPSPPAFDLLFECLSQLHFFGRAIVTDRIAPVFGPLIGHTFDPSKYHASDPLTHHAFDPLIYHAFCLLIGHIFCPLD